MPRRRKFLSSSDLKRRDFRLVATRRAAPLEVLFFAPRHADWKFSYYPCTYSALRLAALAAPFHTLCWPVGSINQRFGAVAYRLQIANRP